MTGQRTVTVQTLDHGPVTLPEPAWCIGHDGALAVDLVDVGHRGPEHALGNTALPLAIAYVSQYPESAYSDAVNVYVELTGDPVTVDPDDAERLADEFARAAEQLQQLARWARILRGGA